MIVGVDEAGRGPLAGMVVGCALALKKPAPPTLKDSKQLSPLRRKELFFWLRQHAIFAVGMATHTEIDQSNILAATFLAFDRAISGLIKKAPKLKKAKFIIDGSLFRSRHKINYLCQPKADQTVKEVSAASIVAKVSRDYFMDLADYLYPQWGFAQHKGYPTKTHYALLEKFSLSPLHRCSFSPCRKYRQKK